jgi:hypothetical protein
MFLSGKGTRKAKRHIASMGMSSRQKTLSFEVQTARENVGSAKTKTKRNVIAKRAAKILANRTGYLKRAAHRGTSSPPKTLT